jgi:hypothetical protein
MIVIERFEGWERIIYLHPRPVGVKQFYYGFVVDLGSSSGHELVRLLLDPPIDLYGKYRTALAGQVRPPISRCQYQQ